MEAAAERLSPRAALRRHLDDGVVRRKRQLGDSTGVRLRNDGTPALHLSLPDCAHGSAIGDLVRRVDIDREGLGVVHNDDAPVSRIPHHADGRGGKTGDRDGLVDYRVEDEGGARSVYKNEPRRHLVCEQARDSDLMPVLIYGHAVGQVDVGDGAATGTVDQEVFGHGHAGHVRLLLGWRENIGRRATRFAECVQVYAPLRADCDELCVQQHLVYRAHVLALAHKRALRVCDRVEEDVVVHSNRDVCRPERGEGGLHRDLHTA
eukprot:scaffold4757_cov28-Tisochrysis_lutea.AAC.3